ncbi:MAG: DUF1573 domain-containing protein [Prevotella sp.]|nr:DUF1573 domain-containing protein [Prevotella sp.]
MLIAFAGCKQERKPITDRNWKFIFLEKKQIFLNMGDLDTLHASFAYYNNTGKTQIIEDVKTTCGCTSVDYPHKVIKAGERGKVKMSVKVGKNSGYVSQSAAIYFRGQKPVLLRVIGKPKKETDTIDVFKPKQDLQNL